jgi:formate dehydrogenase major subunit
MDLHNKVGKLIQSWPVYRQLTGADALGRGKAAQSARSVGLEPRTASDG